jgi:hypothetical protein
MAGAEPTLWGSGASRRRQSAPDDLHISQVVSGRQGDSEHGIAEGKSAISGTTNAAHQPETVSAKHDPLWMVQHKRPHVITNPSQVEHLGATRATNNTGELSAVCHALTGARELARPGEAGAHSLRLADRDLHPDWRMGVAQEQGAGRAQQESPSGPTGRGHEGLLLATSYQIVPKSIYRAICQLWSII